MNKQIKQVSLGAMFIAMSGILSIIQIPIAINIGLYLDFSFVILFISNRYIGLGGTLIVSLTYPFFSQLGISPGLPGMFFLMMQAMFFTIFDYLFLVNLNNNKILYNIISTIIVILIVTIISIIINVFIYLFIIIVIIVIVIFIVIFIVIIIIIII
ncbi:MAG: hypothetical protein HRS50_02055, partial [Mycoplasmataceae bacterium]|nr:hypothetical protein [Mycoplasmataceae bacterium]